MQSSQNHPRVVSGVGVAPQTGQTLPRRRQASAASIREADELQQQTKLTNNNSKLNLTNPHASVGATSGGSLIVNSVGGGNNGLPSSEYNINLGDLTQTPRRRVSAVPMAALCTYQVIRRILGVLTCFIAIVDLALAVADSVIGFWMISVSKEWICVNASVGRSVFASGMTGVLFSCTIVFTHYLATGTTVVHSCITAILMVASLIHTCSALPRIQLSFQAVECTGKIMAYLPTAAFGRLATLFASGLYYGLLNYYVCRFGEDSTTVPTPHRSGHHQR